MLKVKNYFTITLIVSAVIALCLIVFSHSVNATILTETINSTKKYEQQRGPMLSILSTRDVPIFTPGHLTKLVSDTISKFGKTCPPDMAIYIHGFNKSKDDAGEEFNRMQSALKFNNSTITLIGFSWDSKVPWEQAKVNAKNSGAELVKFILVFKSICKDTAIHLVAHSLGAAVVESALTNLDTYLNANTIKNAKIIKSVNLLGAAITNLSITKGTPLGDAIKNVVEKFYNLYSSQDDGLQFNKFFENHNPLGLAGAPNGIIPFNYDDINVTNEIPALSDADGDGNIEECFEEYSPVLVEGDNHCGYIGFRQPFSNSLLNDSAINVVVQGWRSD